MNKKTLVQQVIEQMEKANVIFAEETQVWSNDRFWTRYPEGHYASSYCHCVEEHLSCLDEQSLQKILELVPFTEGIEFDALWKSWGQAGCFKCEPTILTWENKKVPILRIRHDSYLHYMGGYAFQNSYDAHCNGSNGASNNLEQDIRAITWSEYSLGEEQDEYTIRPQWEEKWALFRKAMIVQHSFVACGGRQTFHAVLDNNPDVFDQFINLTDQRVMHLNLDPELTLEGMRRQCSGQGYDWRRGACELSMMCQGQLYGKLRFGETSVSFSWRRNGETQCSTIDFPEWNKQTYFDELYDIGDMNAGYPQQLSQREYLRSCWTGLAVMLLSLEGVGVSQGFCAPRKGTGFELTTVCLAPPEGCADNLRDIWDKIDSAVRLYPGYKELRDEFMSAT